MSSFCFRLQFRFGFFKKLLPLIPVLVGACHSNARAQSSAAKSTPPASSGSSGFSIETEMLTYRALESNTQALACDIAGVIRGAKPDFAHPADGAGCSVPGGSAQGVVVLLPFERTELDEFAAWQMAMVELAELQSKAAVLGCPKDAATRAGTSTSALSSFLSMSPAGPPLAMAQTVLGLLSSEEATTAVGGNIADLAFINSVARQLKALNVSVITASLYAPGSLDVADDVTSPFLASKRRTLLARGCLSSLKPANDQDTANVKQAIADIDNYMATLGADKPKAASTPAAPTPTGAASPSQSATGAATAMSTASLSVILHADGLAKKLGYRFNGETGKLSQPAPGHYILMVKALESGGSVTGHTNILGTRLRYSGGSVGTYALFATDGDLACAGNVYDYAGSLSGKHFDRDLARVRLDPAKQVIFRSGSCRVANAQGPAVPASNPIH